REAISVAGSLSTPFLAKVVERLIPEKAINMILAYPQKDLIRIMKELLKNGKYYTLGSFVDHLPHDKLHILANEIPTADDLLKIAIYAFKKDHLAGLIVDYSDDRLLNLVTSANKLDLWGDMLEIISYFSEKESIRFASLSDQMDDQILLTIT